MLTAWSLGLGGLRQNEISIRQVTAHPDAWQTKRMADFMEALTSTLAYFYQLCRPVSSINIAFVTWLSGRFVNNFAGPAGIGGKRL